MMKSAFGVILFPEMFGLWLLESSVGFSVSYALLLSLQPPLYDPLLTNFPGMAAVGALVLTLTIGLVSFVVGLYRPETCINVRHLLLKTAVTAILSIALVFFVTQFAHIEALGVSGEKFGWSFWFAFTGGGLLATRLLYIAALRMGLLVRRVAVLGAAAAPMIDIIASTRRGLFRVETILSQTSYDLGRLPKGLWGVVYEEAGVPANVPVGVRTFNFESFSENQLGRIDIAAAALRGTGESEFGRTTASNSAADAIRRAADIIAALVLLVLTAPVLVITALLIRFGSPGPVFYRQERVGLGGRSFTLWKFRSMRVDAERFGPAWASLQDSRVTAVGSIIRKVRIDELPQLINILRGEMSMVGPRPERPHFVEQLADALPLYRERSRVKPGLTGWAQVSYPYGASIEDAWAKLSYDLYYVKHRNLFFDLYILLATVRVILFQEGAR